MLNKFLHINLSDHNQMLVTVKTKPIPLFRRSFEAEVDDRRIHSFDKGKIMNNQRYHRYQSVIVNRKYLKPVEEHVPIPVSSSVNLGGESTKRKCSMFKLPLKQQKIKKLIESRQIDPITRPCRHDTEMSTQKQRSSENIKPKKLRKILKFKQIKNTVERKEEQQGERNKKKNENKNENENMNQTKIENQEEFPTNTRLLMKNKVSMLESKVISIQRGEDLEDLIFDEQDRFGQGKQMGSPQNIADISDDHSKHKSKQKKKQQHKQEQSQSHHPKFLQQEQQHEASTNPISPQLALIPILPAHISNQFLHKKTQYQQKNIQGLQQKIEHVLNLTMSPPHTRILLVPDEDKITQFIQKYVPISAEINDVKELVLSNKFQIVLTKLEEGEGREGGKWLYFGEMQNGEYDGLGIKVSETQIKEGLWERGVLVQGAVKNVLGVYRGSFDHNGQSGKGQFIYSSGCWYKGHWRDNKRDGNGYFQWSNKESYLGDWNQGYLEGTGTLKTGYSTYSGTFRKSKKQGTGKQTFNNGDIFKGQFMSNLPNGKGQYIWSSGIFYEGEFQQGFRHGCGVLFCGDGVQYQGEFFRNLPSGEGKFVYSSGECQSMFFEAEKVKHHPQFSKKYSRLPQLGNSLIHQLQQQ